jgi:3-oxoacyl-[acyl-carrier-protein] synthase-1
MKINITGLGVISSIGNNITETFESLINSRAGVKDYKVNFSPEKKIGRVDFSNKELITKFKIKTNGSRSALLGMIAAKEAYKGHESYDNIRTGLIAGTSVGGISVSSYERYLRLNKVGVNDFVHHSSGTCTKEIATELNINGFVNTLSTACSSSTNAIIMGARMIRNNLLDRVVVGGMDALTPFTINGFSSLMIYDDEFCKPFDEKRAGLNLGEGAGFIVLESDDSIAISKKEKLATLSGWNCSSDAYHQTASSPDGRGATLSMQGALDLACLQPKDIDYINAHGTSTPNNDLSESQAIINVFGENIPPFGSTKSYTGHTLAASGGIEAVFSIFALKNKCLFPNLNFKSSIEETELTPIKKLQKEVEIKNVMSNSFGFGGNNTTVIFSR